MMQLEKSKRLKEKRNQPDEDGFITVVHSTKTNESNGKKRKKKGELVNFYRFQQKENKMKELDELRKKFELDKKKIEEMKNQRKFKPF